MNPISNDNFGPLISYLLPGTVALVGIASFSDTLQNWLAAGPQSEPTIGGFLYLTLAAFGVGMTVSAVRWIVIDSIHGWMGIKAPALDFGKLGKNVEAFSLLIESHYRHYQFHANMVIAVAFMYGCFLASGKSGSPWNAAIVLIVEAVFFATSRDNLRKYYRRSAELLPAS